MTAEGEAFDRLVGVMRRLLGPGGCPWDREQTPDSMRAHVLEETYEVLAALDERNAESLKEELGDLLYQVVFLAALHEEKRAFTPADVVSGIADKLVRRHPWVFGDAKAASPDDAINQWEKLKGDERQGKKKDSVLDGIPRDLPALAKAHRLSVKAAKVGFDWPDVASVLAKLDEEIGEFREAVKSGDASKMEDEMGDLLFTLANASRKLALDPEASLRRTNEKFVKRFKFVEKSLRAQGKAPETATLEEMEALWQRAKTDA